MADKCAKCGSEKIIPNVPILDHYGDLGLSSQGAEVEVRARPGSWFFSGPVTGKLLVRVCGACGAAELSVTNAQELYDAYQQSLNGRDAGGPLPLDNR